MIKNNRIIITLLAAAFLFYSCKKTVHLNLNTAAAQLVIQGEVTDAAGPYTITLNQTTAFYADNTFPPISGAAIKISDSQGGTDSLTETSPGNYTTSTLQGVSGHTYTLSVSLQAQTYTAVSTMPALVNLDAVTFQHTSGFGNDRITAEPNFQDPAGIHNYYQFIEYINGVQFTKDIFVFDDRLSDGKYITDDLRTDSSYLSVGDRLEVKMYCIDVNVYNYFNQLETSGGSGAFNTSASPGNPTSNISNGAYGYFSAHTVQSKTVTVY